MKGSRYWLQTYIEKYPEIVSWAITNECTFFTAFDFQDIEWLSPLQSKRFYEFREDILDAFHLSSIDYRLNAFWPRNKPVWDGLAVLRKRTHSFFLIEAKAHIQETVTRMAAVHPVSKQRIRETLNEVKRYMGVDLQRDWTQPYYQFCNRLAFLYFFTVIAQKPAFLVFINFVDDPTLKSPTTRSDWERHYKKVFDHLGIKEDSHLMDHVLFIYLSARK